MSWHLAQFVAVSESLPSDLKDAFDLAWECVANAHFICRLIRSKEPLPVPKTVDQLMCLHNLCVKAGELVHRLAAELVRVRGCALFSFAGGPRDSALGAAVWYGWSTLRAFEIADPDTRPLSAKIDDLEAYRQHYLGVLERTGLGGDREFSVGDRERFALAFHEAISWAWDVDAKELALAMRREVIAIAERREDSQQLKPEWRPEADAIRWAAERGYDVTHDWCEKRKDKIKMRRKPPDDPGRHKREVEMNSFRAILLAEAKPKPKDADDAETPVPDTDAQSPAMRERIEANKRQEKREKEKGRRAPD